VCVCVCVCARSAGRGRSAERCVCVCVCPPGGAPAPRSGVFYVPRPSGGAVYWNNNHMRLYKKGNVVT